MLSTEEISELWKCDTQVVFTFWPSMIPVTGINRLGFCWVQSNFCGNILHRAKEQTKKQKMTLCDFLSSTKTSLNCFSLCSIRNVSLHCNSSTKLSDCLVSNGRYLTHFSSASCFILIDNIWASNNTCSSEFQKTLFKFLKMQYW